MQMHLTYSQTDEQPENIMPLTHQLDGRRHKTNSFLSAGAEQPNNKKSGNFVLPSAEFNLNANAEASSASGNSRALAKVNGQAVRGRSTTS